MSLTILSTPIHGVSEVVGKAFCDHRGLFLSAFRREDWQNIWGERPIAQVNVSRTERIGAVRGLHFQKTPWAEAKLVRCLRGRVWDVAVDLRPGSPTWGRWHASELSPGAANALMIPEGCAHGFQVLDSGSELLYLHSAPYRPDSEAGVRWDDPRLAVNWPLPATDLSERDRQLPLLEPEP